MILPMENRMSDPVTMTSRFGVINISITLVTIVYVALAFFGYLRFGDNAQGSITLNLPNEPLYNRY